MTVIWILAATILALSFPRIGTLRLDRAAVALAGAVLAALVGGMSPHDAYALVHWDTIMLLFGMFVVCGTLDEAGFFSWLAYQSVMRAPSARWLVASLVFVSGLASAILVNDTVCLLFAPFVLAVSDETKLDPLPFLLAVGMGANVGGVATYTGTPQTMIVGSLSGIPYRDYAFTMMPIAVACLGITAALLVLMFRSSLPAGRLAPRSLQAPPLDKGLLARVLPILAITIVGFSTGFPLAGVALIAACAALLFSGHDPQKTLARVDWSLLLFFASLFVVTGAAAKTGIVDRVFDAATWAHPHDVPSYFAFSGFVAVASNFVSNVPLVLMAAPLIDRLQDAHLGWLVLALASTFAGNLTLVGSVANLIVIEAARDRVEVSFWRFLRYGAVITLVTLLVGVAWLLTMY